MRPISPLPAHLGYWLRLVSNHVSSTFTRRLAEQGVGVAEWVLLRELFDREDMSPAELAEALGMTRGAISKLEDRLAGRALIVRSPDATDRRSHRLALSSEGRALVPRLAEIADANDEACFGGLDEPARAELARVLRRLAALHHLTHHPLA
jgi:DNA-binding MarR family transcriptional regulator